MLIQPATQNATQVAGFVNSSTPTGVEQESVRADIPPVIETEKNAGGQNERFPGVQQNQVQSPQQETADASQESAQASEASQAGEQKASSSTESQSSSGITLTEEDQALLQQLKARDREVRVHEAAHAAVGGRYAGSASLQYTRGPDGRNYAVGGEVSISTSEVAGDPQATIEKAKVIQAAALAPAQPSSQDRRVAAEASQMEVQARAELQAMKAEELQQEKEARAQKQEEAQAKKDELDAESSAEEVVEEEPIEPVTVSVATTSAEPSGQEGEESSERDSDSKQRTTAREDLEKILLGSTGLLQQANQQGLVDPQNPYGKSGFLDVIA